MVQGDAIYFTLMVVVINLLLTWPIHGSTQGQDPVSVFAASLDAVLAFVDVASVATVDPPVAPASGSHRCRAYFGRYRVAIVALIALPWSRAKTGNLLAVNQSPSLQHLLGRTLWAGMSWTAFS